MFSLLCEIAIGEKVHCVKSVHFRSGSGPYSVRLRENTDQNNTEYGHFLRSGMISRQTFFSTMSIMETLEKCVKYVQI